MPKKILAILLVFTFTMILFPGATLADTESGALDSGEQSVLETMDLSMEDALKLGEENNSLLKQARLARDKSKIQTNQAHAGAKKVDEEYATTLELGKVKYYNEKAAKISLQVAEKTYEVAHEQVALLIKSHYLDVLKKQELVTVKQLAVERAQKQLETANVNFQVGTVAKTDVLTAEVGLAQAKAELTAAKNNLKLSEITLCTDLGLDTNTHLSLSSTIQYEAFTPVDLAKVIEDSMAGHLEIAKCQAAKELADENYNITVAYSAPNTYTAKLAKNSADSAMIELEDARDKVIANITGSYLSVLAAEEMVNTYAASVEQAREADRLTSLRYQVGMATSLDVLNTSVQLSNVEASRIEAIYNHYLAKLTFETSKLALTSGS